jgi:hypothetical protein
MQDAGGTVRNLVIGMLLLAAPFAVAYLLARNDPNAQILLVVAVFALGLALTFAVASGLQAVGGLALRLSGRPPRDILVVGLAGLSLLTPWTIAISVAGLQQVFGWANPLAWALAFGLLVSTMRSASPYHGVALIVSGAALLAWVGWASWLITTPGFSHQQFSFAPVDVLSTGWYAGLIGTVIAVDGFASRRARQPGHAGAGEIWWLSLVPGAGLVRLGYAGRGRLWLGAAALAVAFIGISAINDSEFAYWGHYNTTPPDRGRLDVAISAAALALVYLLSWLDTWRSLRRRVVMGDWLSRITARSKEDAR